MAKIVKKAANKKKVATQGDIEYILNENLQTPERIKDGLSGVCDRLSHLSQDKRQFIFEMAQNVDDTPHTSHKAELYLALVKYNPADGTPLKYPYLMVMSRQDGFTLCDLQGICNVANGRNSDQAKKSKSAAAAAAPDAEEPITTGEKGVGFKSVFTVSTEPMIISTHISNEKKTKKSGDAIVKKLLFGTKAAQSHDSLQFSIPSETKQFPSKDDDGEVDSIPYMTPMPLQSDKVQLMDSMINLVNKHYETDISLTSGTILALPLNHQIEDGSDNNPDAEFISKLLEGNNGDSEQLSPIDFMFLNTIRKVALLVFERADQYCGRIFR